MVIVVVVMIVVMIVVVVVVIVPMFVPMIVPMFVPMFVAMVFAIVGNVSFGVPVMLDEIDRLAAGVVLAAMMAPIVLIAWAHMQIDRWRQRSAMNAYSHDRRVIDEAGRRRVADIHATVKARVAQADGDPHLCERCAAERHGCKSHGEKEFFHVHAL
jgi:hypothetical protein